MDKLNQLEFLLSLQKLEDVLKNDTYQEIDKEVNDLLAKIETELTERTCAVEFSKIFNTKINKLKILKNHILKLKDD